MLQRLQSGEKRLERTSLQRFVRCRGLAGRESIKPRGLENALRLVRKDDAIAVEGDPEFRRLTVRPGRSEDRRRRDAARQRLGDVLRHGRQEQVAVECAHIAVGIRATPERRPLNIEPMRANRVEDAQARIRRVARQKDYIDFIFAEYFIDIYKFFDEGEGVPRLEHLVFVLDLVLAIGFEPALLENAIAGVQIKQRPRRDRYRE